VVQNKSIASSFNFHKQAIFFLFFISLVAGFASAATLNVGPEQTYTTIQSAIDAAASSGDIINVAAGTYAEHITIGKSLDLLGASKTTTIIDGGSSGVVITISASNVVVKGFTIENSGTDIAAHAGIVMAFVTGCTVENNIIQNSASGIALLSSSNNFLKDNSISGSARYGIVADYYPGNSTHPSLANMFSGNVITTSGRDGIYLGQDADNNQITGNSISGTTGTTEGSNYEGNGIYFWKSSGNTVTENTISIWLREPTA